MFDFVNRIVHALLGIWRYRWLALLIGWLVGMTGWVIVDRLEHRYGAIARIYVDTNRVLEPLLNNIAVQSDVKQRVALVSQTLKSRPNLERLAASTGMGAEVDSPHDYEQLLKKLESDIVIFDASGTRSLYTIGYAHTDPGVAYGVVQSMIDIFIESNVGEDQEDNTAAQAFLDQRIAEYETRLEQAEQRLSDFKRQNAGAMPNEAGGYYQRLSQAEIQLRKSSLELKEALNRRDEISRQLESETPIILGDDPGRLSVEEERLKGLQDRLDALLVRYTDRHPQVSQLREAIADMEKKKAERDALGVVSSERRDVLQKSVVYQRMRTMLAEAEANVAELRVRVEDQATQVKELRNTIDSIPQVEAELAQLNRDYETVKRQHEVLLEKRESARLTEQAERNAGDETFRLVDPPFVSTKPTEPNKKLLNLVVLVAAIGLGGAGAFAMSLLHPVFYDNRALATYTNLPVLGNVMLVQSVRERWRSRAGLATFSLLCLMFMGVFGAFMYLQLQNLDLERWATQNNVALVIDVFRAEIWTKLAENRGVQALKSFLESAL